MLSLQHFLVFTAVIYDFPVLIDYDLPKIIYCGNIGGYK